MKVNTNTPGVIIIQPKGSSAASWIAAAASVATLAVIGVVGKEVLDQAGKLEEVTQNIKHPMKALRGRFGKKGK